MKYIVVAKDHGRQNVISDTFKSKKEAETRQNTLEKSDLYSEVVILVGRSEEKIFAVYPEYKLIEV